MTFGSKNKTSVWQPNLKIDTSATITAHRETASKQGENSILLNNHEINFVLQLEHQTASVSIKFCSITDKKSAFYATSLT
jgi:hypothetical protein